MFYTGNTTGNLKIKQSLVNSQALSFTTKFGKKKRKFFDLRALFTNLTM